MNASIKIMLIDDEATMRKLCKRQFEAFFSDLQFDFLEFDNGLKALNHIVVVRHLPDVILLDLNMPVMGGEAFVREYLALPMPKIYTDIYIVSSSLQYLNQEIRDAVNGCYEKPLHENHALEIIRAL